jgi:hypothetical protein
MATDAECNFFDAELKELCNLAAKLGLAMPVADARVPAAAKGADGCWA